MASSSSTSSAPATKACNVKDKWEPSTMKFTNLPLLEGTDNYRSWAQVTLMVLDTYEVFDLIMGIEIKPTESDTHQNWIRKQRQARAALFQLMSPQCMHHVDRNLDAHTIWKNIEDTYDRKNLTSNLHSLNAQLSLAIDNSTSIRDHIQEFESRCLRL